MVCSVCQERVNKCANGACDMVLRDRFYCFGGVHFCSRTCWKVWFLSGEEEKLTLASGEKEIDLNWSSDGHGTRTDEEKEEAQKELEKDKDTTYHYPIRKLSVNYQGKTYLRSDAAMPIQIKKSKKSKEIRRDNG